MRTLVVISHEVLFQQTQNMFSPQAREHDAASEARRTIVARLQTLGWQQEKQKTIGH